VPASRTGPDPLKHYEDTPCSYALIVADPIRWMSTKGAADYLGVNLRTLYRFIDEGGLAAYKFGRVIRLKEDDVVAFVESSRIVPGSLEHLYPEPVRTDGR
jgi:excisionase family DNA binding protein